MKSNKILSSVGLITIVVFASIAVPTHSRAQTQAEWTIAIFACVDNNLEAAWDRFSDKFLSNLQDSEDVNVVAAVDRYGPTGTELVQYSGGARTVVATFEEMDFETPGTVAWFIQEVATRYPSNHLALVLSDHGAAWRGVCFDDTGPAYALGVSGLASAISSVGVFIDIVAFDACLMSAAEVAYELSFTNLIGEMVSSEQIVPNAGFPYNLMLAPLAADPSRSREQVAVDMVNGWNKYYGARSTDLAALNVSSISATIGGQFATWCGVLRADMTMYKSIYHSAVEGNVLLPRKYDYFDQYDIGQIARDIAADTSVQDPQLKQATADLLSSLGQGVLARTGGSGKDPLCGLAIYWGTSATWGQFMYWYSYETRLPIETGWFDFLVNYNSP